VSARAQVRLAEALRSDLPAVGELLRTGQVTVEHARAAVGGVRGLDPTVVRDSEPAICQLLQAADPPTVRAELRERAEAISPELGRDAERRAQARRGFTADQTAYGVLLGGMLAPEAGQVVLHGLDLAVQADRAAGAADGVGGEAGGEQRSLRQRRADVLTQWARQAIAAAGDPHGALREDLRTSRTQLLLSCTAEQLAAAARLAHLGGKTPTPGGVTLPLVGLAEDVTGPAPVGTHPSDGTGGGGGTDGTEGTAGNGGNPGTGGTGTDIPGWPWTCPGPTAGPAQPDGAGQPDGLRVPAGGSLAPGVLVGLQALRRLVCDASVALVVTPDPTQAPEDGTAPNPLGIRLSGRRDDPLYAGRAARIVTAAQWRALVVRDRHCVITGCRRRPVQCQAHHVRHWLDGGPTDLDNLVLLCFQHHHDHHDRRRDLQHRDGRWLTSAGWREPAPP
jgi:hypothetical protein